MSNELSTIENADLIFEPKNITKETIKKYLCPNATDQELMMGLQIAKTFNLNPLKREVYFVKYGAGNMQVLTGYEVYLKRAERSTKWDGMEVTSEGSVEQGNLKGIVKIFRKDWQHPLTHETHYSEYVQRKSDGTINAFWKNKPVTMIKKVCVSQAFRLAFPDEFDGMPYTSDEVIDQDKVADIKIDEPLQMPTAKPPKLAKETVENELQTPFVSVPMGNITPVVEQLETKPNAETKMNIDAAEECKISNDCGLKMLEDLAKSGKTKDDLKAFILNTFELKKLSEIRYKHMSLINQFIKGA